MNWKSRRVTVMVQSFKIDFRVLGLGFRVKDLAVIVEEFRMDWSLHAVLDFGEQFLTSGINLGEKYVYSRAFLAVLASTPCFLSQ